MSSSSCWESITSAMSLRRQPTPAPAPALQVQLLEARDVAAAAAHRATVEQLRERADALRRKIDEVTGEAEAADEAARHAEMRAREAADGLSVAVGTKEMNEERLRVLAKEMEVKDGRIRVLEAIVGTLSGGGKSCPPGRRIYCQS